MRPFLLAALACTSFAATMTVEAPDANAVVYCVNGIVRAGCVVRPVVRAPIVYCKTVGVPKGCVVRR